MRSLFVLQHCDSEFLGLMEDHFEGRGIKFQYVRPFIAGAKVPGTAFNADGLVVMGGGAWGSCGGRVLPTLDAELRLTRDFLNRKKPVIAWGLGAQVLCLATGGSAEPCELTIAVDTATRIAQDALNGYLPESYPLVTLMRDRPVPPPEARMLAVDSQHRPAAFQIGANAFGFTGHPGIKPGIVEDLIMEFDDPLVDATGAPSEPAGLLDAVRARQMDIANALVPIMTGLVQATGLMAPYDADEAKRRTVIPIQR